AIVTGATAELAARHAELVPAARLWNGLELPGSGGLVTTYEVPAGASPDPVPIGRPLQNVRCYVLDARREPTSPGAPGELWVGGDAAALLGRSFSLASAEARLELDPFRRDDPEARILRLGTRVRWRDDGLLELAPAGDLRVE